MWKAILGIVDRLTERQNAGILALLIGVFLVIMPFITYKRENLTISADADPLVRLLVIVIGIILILFGLWDFFFRAKEPMASSKTTPTGTETASIIGRTVGHDRRVLIDISHGQADWPRTPSNLLRLGEPTSFGRVAGDLADLLQISPIETRDQLNRNLLDSANGLIFGPPLDDKGRLPVIIDKGTIDTIVQWVQSGGRLLLLHFELADRHHRTNMTELAGKFGLYFSNDIVAPEGWGKHLSDLPSWSAGRGGRPYGEPISFSAANFEHDPILNGVQTLTLSNLCTLRVDFEGKPIIRLGSNPVSVESFPNTGAGYTNGWLRIAPSELLYTSAPWMPVMARAPRGLCGKGEVVAIGTWEVYGPNDGQINAVGNREFVQNLLRWCGGIALTGC
jgi:hypothetical protein